MQTFLVILKCVISKVNWCFICNLDLLSGLLELNIHLFLWFSFQTGCCGWGFEREDSDPYQRNNPPVIYFHYIIFALKWSQVSRYLFQKKKRRKNSKWWTGVCYLRTSLWKNGSDLVNCNHLWGVSISSATKVVFLFSYDYTFGEEVFILETFLIPYFDYCFT